MKQRVAILGATGELGYRLIPLLAEKYELNCIIRNPDKRDFSVYPNVNVFLVEDVTQTDKLAQAFEGCDAIINTAYIWFASEIKAALDRLKKKPEHIVFTGSTGVFTRIRNSKGAEKKRTAEHYIEQNYDINYTIIRPTMIYGHKDDGNIARLAKALKKLPLFPLIGKAENLIQPVFYKDLLKAYTVALLNSDYYQKSYNIGGPEAIPNKTLFQLTAKEIGTKVVFFKVPALLVLFFVKILSFFRISPVSEEQVLRFGEDKNIDIVPFIEAFGYTTKSINEGIKELVKDINDGTDDK